LVRELELLKSPAYLEKIARERFSFGRTGERIYVLEEDTTKDSAMDSIHLNSPKMSEKKD